MADGGDSGEGRAASGGVAGLRRAFDAMPRERRWLVLGVAGAVLVALVYIATGGASGETWRPVARSMMPEDAETAIAALEAKKIPYKLADHGTLNVPEEHIHEARLALAIGTMPSGRGVGFELFDEAEMGRSAFSEKVNYHRALEGELARTIRHIEGIDRARVHLVIPARRVFKELDTKASASVVLALRPGFEVGPRQAHAIRQLVAGGVERLEPQQVAIVDQYGSMLARPSGGVGLDASSNFEHQVELERSLEQRVVSLLEPVVGAGHVRAQVALKIDYDRVVETKEVYDPDGQVVRSEREQVEKMESTKGDGGPVGTAGNLPRPANVNAGGAPESRSSKERSDTIRNYDIDKSTTRRESPSPRVARMSIAVLVDEAPDGAGATRPRTSEEIAQYSSIIASAVGLDPARGDKIEVASVQFTPRETFEEPDVGVATAPEGAAGLLDDELTRWIAIGVGALLLIGLAVFLATRRRRKKAVGSRLDLVIDEPANPEPVSEADARRARIAELRERAQVLAREDLRRLSVVFERWFDADKAAAAAASPLAAATAASPDQEAAA